MTSTNAASRQQLSWRFIAAVCFACVGGPTTVVGMPVGFASLNGGTTGGAAGPTVTATTSLEFQNFAEQAGPLTIKVDGILNVENVEIASDKTIVGIGATSGLVGSLRFNDVSNIIVQNLSISNPNEDGEGDALTLRESTNIWIDHNNIFDSPDGLLDIVNESDFVTVSWNKFFYTDDYAQNVNTSHRFAMLIGNSDGATQDADNLRVTLHHNHWGANIRERMPRLRYGDVHVFNNYFNTPGNNYAVRAAIGAEVLVENNSFEDVDDPYEKFPPDSGPQPLIEASGNLFVNTSGDMDAGDDVFDPTYAYTLDDAQDVKDLVLNGAGVGFAPLPGDYNQDGKVDAADYTVWRDNLGQPAGTLPNDVDGGVIDQDQYNTWRDNFGGQSGEASLARNAAGVPEPSAVVIFTIAAAGLLAFKRSRT